MKILRIGDCYKLFTLKINGIVYYCIASRTEKGICMMTDNSGEAVKHFEHLEECSKYWSMEK